MNPWPIQSITDNDESARGGADVDVSVIMTIQFQYTNPLSAPPAGS